MIIGIRGGASSYLTLTNFVEPRYQISPHNVLFYFYEQMEGQGHQTC